MIPRLASHTLRNWAAIFRVIAIVGARQSGKTTLARTVFADLPYVSLEDPDQRRLANEDPRGLFASLPRGAILDEVQRCPDLLSYLQGIVDADPRPGRWILTGSAHLHLIEAVSQSLAGRAGLLELPTCSQDECTQAGVATTDLGEALVRGGYPEPISRGLPPDVYYQAYLSSVLERDLRQVVQVRDLEIFRRFTALCAGRVGQLINRASLGAEAGVSADTVDRWLAALQAAHLIFLLRPHHANFGKRIIKAPKLYFADPALAVRLLGVRNAEQARTHPLWGSLVENWVIAEIRRGFANRGEVPPLWFWRDHHGDEIDLLIETSTGLVPVEIKAGATLASDWFVGLRRWRAWAGAQAGPAHLICGAQTVIAAPSDIHVLPWHQAGRVRESLGDV